MVEPMCFVAVLPSDVVHDRPRNATAEFHDDVLSGWVDSVERASAYEYDCWRHQDLESEFSVFELMIRSLILLFLFIMSGNR